MSKKPIDLMSVNVDQIVVSDKFKHNNEDFKYFYSLPRRYYLIILPQMSGYIKSFEKGGENMMKCGENTKKNGMRYR